MKRETVFGILGVLLYTQPSVAQKSVTDTVRLNFNIDSVALEEVVVKGARTPAANSRWSDMHPVELVTVGGANGDLYKALQTLPGTQVQGETGELLVRGGGSYETQTFIDGMHVLNPYTSNGINSPCSQPLLYIYVQWGKPCFGRRFTRIWRSAFGSLAIGNKRLQQGR